MIPVRLIVTDQSGEVAVFQRDENGVSLVSASDDVRADLQQWMSRGLIELIGPRRDRQQRVTQRSDPAFLTRVAQRLRQYGFIVKVAPSAVVMRPEDRPRADAPINIRKTGSQRYATSGASCNVIEQVYA